MPRQPLNLFHIGRRHTDNRLGTDLKTFGQKFLKLFTVRQKLTDTDVDFGLSLHSNLRPHGPCLGPMLGPKCVGIIYILSGRSL